MIKKTRLEEAIEQLRERYNVNTEHEYTNDSIESERIQRALETFNTSDASTAGR
ncbi:hypothetical protein HJ059_18530 [Vibrio parahaemolyticus]|nr:hypothetical protein [Vibrio parahaemolyticus]MDF4994600.1 hypothetical protein [Vibrio parahaemolyticus]HCH1607421.1 hypothetical protein [Vibrio parahaemolyticus]HCM0850438.1 hypothetical protein [Vibrio parahaemolyticus]